MSSKLVGGGAAEEEVSDMHAVKGANPCKGRWYVERGEMWIFIISPLPLAVKLHNFINSPH